MVKTIKKVFKVAVTGGAGSGKSSVCNRLKELGITIISSDTLAREAVAPGSTAHKKILNYFGEKVVLSDGKLNRQMLRRIIVNDGVARRSLEQFIHPEWCCPAFSGAIHTSGNNQAHAAKDGSSGKER